MARDRHSAPRDLSTHLLTRYLFECGCRWCHVLFWVLRTLLRTGTCPCPRVQMTCGEGGNVAAPTVEKELDHGTKLTALTSLPGVPGVTRMTPSDLRKHIPWAFWEHSRHPGGLLTAAPSKPRNFQGDPGQKGNAHRLAENGVFQREHRSQAKHHPQDCPPPPHWHPSIRARLNTSPGGRRDTFSGHLLASWLMCTCHLGLQTVLHLYW